MELPKLFQKLYIWVRQFCSTPIDEIPAVLFHISVNDGSVLQSSGGQRRHPVLSANRDFFRQSLPGDDHQTRNVVRADSGEEQM